MLGEAYEDAGIYAADISELLVFVFAPSVVDLLGDVGRLEHAKRATVLGGQAVDIFRRCNAACGGHVAWHDGRIAGYESGQMHGGEARAQIIAAPFANPDDQLYLPTPIEILNGIGIGDGRRSRKYQSRKGC